MQHRWTAIAIGSVLLCLALRDDARAVVLVPSVDFSARRTGSSTGGSSGGPSLEYRLDSTASPRLDYRAAMEFPLAGLPTNQVLASATLRLMPTAKTGDSVLEAHGYLGNGLFAASDAFGDPNLLGDITGHAVGVQKSVDLDLTYITSLIGSATHLGIFLREFTNLAQGTFASRSTATPPQLELIFLNPNGPNSNRWTATGTGDWNTSANWSFGAPIASDDIFIQPSSAATVLAPATFEDVKTLTLGGGAGQATFVVTENQQFQSHGLTTVYGNGVLDINGGTYRTGGLNIRTGGTIDWGDDGTLAIESGYLSTPTGPFTVEGPQTPILAMIGGHLFKLRTNPSGPADSVIIGDTQGGYLIVAFESEVRTAIMRVGNQATGNGTVQIEEGGVVHLGALMEVGPNGTGRLDVQEGGRLEGGIVVVGSTLQGAFNASTPDSATFTDAGTTAKLSSLEANGRSTVEIRDGAVVEAGGAGGSGDMAEPPVLRVTGAGSRLILSDRLQTGATLLSNGASKVIVENGGRIDTDLVVLGVASSMNGRSHAELTVSGAGSELNAASTVLFGGIRGTDAVVNVIDGGVFRAGDQALLTATLNDTADVTISGGGRWEQTGEISIGGGRDLNNNLVDLGTASLTLRDDGVLEATTAVNIMDRGTLVLDGGILKAPLVRHDRGGTFQFTAGRLAVDSFAGNLVNGGGTIAPGDPPGLTAVEGEFTQQAGGRLEIEIGGTTPGTEFDRLTVAVLSGDFNRDGTVDAADYAVWRKNDGMQSGYDMWRANFGRPATGMATLGGALDVSLTNDFVPAAGDSFEVLRADGGIFGQFDTTSLPPLPNELDWNVVYSNFAVVLQVVGGASVNQTVSTAVPEPTSLFLFLLAIGGVTRFGRASV